MSLFAERKMVVATMHHKESVIGPLMRKHFRITCTLIPEFDTDQFGTFSGEIPRKEDALTTALEKCNAAYTITGCDLIVASEGSFGNHPAMIFAPANNELIVLRDFRNNLTITARELTTNTNFNQSIISSEAQLLAFAHSALFPSHGLILRLIQGQKTMKMVKGITERDVLFQTYAAFSKMDGQIQVETDMRAMYNPTRMEVIRQTTEKLIERMASDCPECHTPGFGISEHTPGLPCESCSFPTEMIRISRETCAHCQFQKTISRKDGLLKAPAMYCPNCNP